MTPPDPAVWLVAGYAVVLLAVAWGYDMLARRVSERASLGSAGGFSYHPDRDAWRCPQGHWLSPSSFDPDDRVMRYRATPSVCNVCPAKATCTGSLHGREVSREVDVWPHSRAGRLHRGIALFVAVLGIVMPLSVLLGGHTGPEAAVLAGTAVLVGLGALPLARHLWSAPAESPERPPYGTAVDE